MTFDLKNFRRDKGLTQQKLAELLDVTQSYISEVEIKGRRFSKEAEDKLASIYPDLEEYIRVDETAEADIVKEPEIKKENEFTIRSRKQTIDLQDYIDMIKSQQKMLQSKDEQISELIEIIKRQTKDIK